MTVAGSGGPGAAKKPAVKVAPKSEQKITSGNENKIQSEAKKDGRKIQSPTSGKTQPKTTEFYDDENDVWRFEIKRKKSTAKRKNKGSTRQGKYYYWAIAVHKGTGINMYIGTLDKVNIIDKSRVAKYFRRSRKRKRNA